MALEIGGQKFNTKPISPTWHLMKYAKAQQRGWQASKDYETAKKAGDQKAQDEAETIMEEASNQLLVIQHNLIMRIIKADERKRFEDFMDEADLEPNELEEALQRAISGYDAEERPKEEPLSSLAIVPPIPPKSRVVSLSRGTVVNDPDVVGEISSTG